MIIADGVYIFYYLGKPYRPNECYADIPEFESAIDIMKYWMYIISATF